MRQRASCAHTHTSSPPSSLPKADTQKPWCTKSQLSEWKLASITGAATWLINEVTCLRNGRSLSWLFGSTRQHQNRQTGWWMRMNWQSTHTHTQVCTKYTWMDGSCDVTHLLVLLLLLCRVSWRTRLLHSTVSVDLCWRSKKSTWLPLTSEHESAEGGRERKIKWSNRSKINK